MNSYTPLFTSLPDSADECWILLKRFVDFWHGPVSDYERPSTLSTELKVNIPEAYLSWQRLLPKQNEWSDRAEILGMDRLRIENDRLVVRTESVFNGRLIVKWGIATDLLELPDPPVLSILADREYPCADKVSHFAIFCALFDTVNSHLSRDLPPENDYPFPEDGERAKFPDSFGVIDTEIHEGKNWLALVSGPSWYLRLKSPDGADRFIKHAVRSNRF